MKKLLIAAALLLPFGAMAQTTDPLTQIESPQVPGRGGYDGDSMDQLLAHFRVPGVSMAVIQDFRIAWAKAWGVTDVKTGAHVRTDTMFQAASISKPVTAMATLKAVQDGKFGLDQDINTILKSWKLPMEKFPGAVTPRMLMSHTSGLGDGFGFPGYAPGAPRPTLLQVLDGAQPSVLGPVRMERAPLTGYKYSGGGVSIEQLMLTDVLGKPFTQIMQDTVLGPLRMANSTYAQPIPADKEIEAAHAHDQRGRPLDAPWHVFPEQAAAGLWTTPSDLARFLIEVQQTLRGQSLRVINQKTAEAMIAPVGVGPYAVGFAVEQRGQGWYFTHTGSNWGYRAVVLAHRAKGYGVTIMTNGDNGAALYNEIIERVARAYGWDSLDKPIPR
ncbi:MAG: beta-lactamase family protein [Rhodospirillaceae bacterium]|nr:beta-lactamase family protein [Rhodospirillaceae bacterium]